MESSPVALHDLPVAAMPRSCRVESLDDGPGYALSQDYPYCSSVGEVNKSEEVSVTTESTYTETLTSSEETSKRSAKRKPSFASTIYTFSTQIEEEMALSLSSPAVQSLLSKKLADPEYVLSDQESITLLTHCVAEGEQNAEEDKGKRRLDRDRQYGSWEEHVSELSDRV
jgi:hypothetical protein